MRLRRPKLLRKLPYYLVSLFSLGGIASVRSVVRCLLAPNKRLDLRDGRSLQLATPLDLLVVKETLVDDVYGLRALVAEDGAIVDVGAGIGDFTLAAATRFPGLTVVAFEPNPYAFELLQVNTARHGCLNVELAPVAIGTDTSYVLRGTSSGPRASAAVVDSEDGVVVAARRLDDVVAHGPIRLLKIDCEGLELDVLRSAARLMDRVDRVVVEYHRRLLPEADRVVDDVLREYGFTTHARADSYDADIGYLYATRHGVVKTA